MTRPMMARAARAGRPSRRAAGPQVGLTSPGHCSCGQGLASQGGDPTVPWPHQYKIKPEQKDRLTAADVVGPDGIVYPNWTHCGVQGGIPTVNVVAKIEDFGARANDDLDDSQALQAACEAAGRTGGAVLLGEGTYYLDRPVTVRQDNVVIRGKGPSQTRVIFRYARPAGRSGVLLPAGELARGPGDADRDARQTHRSREDDARDRRHGHRYVGAKPAFRKHLRLRQVLAGISPKKCRTVRTRSRASPSIRTALSERPRSRSSSTAGSRTRSWSPIPGGHHLCGPGNGRRKAQARKRRQARRHRVASAEHAGPARGRFPLHRRPGHRPLEEADPERLPVGLVPQLRGGRHGRSRIDPSRSASRCGSSSPSSTAPTCRRSCRSSAAASRTSTSSRPRTCGSRACSSATAGTAGRAA